ncbi:MAG: V-type ATP synthase subunit D [Candidatus Ranarchaeia archaeon]
MAELVSAPTQMIRLRTIKKLGLAKSGCEILEKKRDLLVKELRRLVYDLLKQRETLVKEINVGIAHLEKAIVYSGHKQLATVIETKKPHLEFTITPRSIMGVVLPLVKTKHQETQPDYGFSLTSFYYDLAFTTMRQLTKILATIIELEASVYKIANAIKKTQIRVNALKHVHIPRYEQLIVYIENYLEEKDREEFVRMKKIKDVLKEKDTHAC